MQEIIPGLFLGSWTDGVQAQENGVTPLCVIETHPEDRYKGMTYYLPILQHDEDTYLSDLPPKVSIVALDDACEIINGALLEGTPILVHCWAGIERSPLTLAYWLVKNRRQPNLDEAYKFLKSKRPQVEDRRSWLPFSLAVSL